VEDGEMRITPVTRRSMKWARRRWARATPPYRRQIGQNDLRSICYRVVVLPELTAEGDLPPGVHGADWQEFQSRFGCSSPRRVWLSGRLRELVELAAISGKLRRVFVWGSFVTAKPVPKDLDILLIMDEDFEVEAIAAVAQTVFDSVRARLLFESDVFWARASIGNEALQLWLETYQISRSFRKRGIVELELP
jgi:predicted nucleotidyltransferase